MRLRLTALALVSAMQSACGGGGGGGGGPAAPVERLSVADRMEETLSYVNYDLDAGNAGNGVTVALLGPGIDRGHPTLAGRVSDSPLAIASTLAADEDIGTFTGMLASGRSGSTVYGMAHESAVEFVCCLANDSAAYVSAIEYVGDVSEAFVVNHSYEILNTLTFTNIDAGRCVSEIIGPDDSVCMSGTLEIDVPQFIVPLLDRFVASARKACVMPDGTADRLCVFSAGNRGMHANGVVTSLDSSLAVEYGFAVSVLLDPVRSPLTASDRTLLGDMLYDRQQILNLPEIDAEFSGHYLIVPAIEKDSDGNDVLSAYSNSCGDSMQHCLSAPGTHTFYVCSRTPEMLCDENQDGTAVSVYSTSFSAPLVTGAAALLKSTFPQLSAEEVVTILLTTAVDIGDPGVDEEFGWGRLDVLESLKPQGPMTSAAGESIQGTGIFPGPAVAAAVAGSDATFGMFDIHLRPYLFPVARQSALRKPGLAAEAKFDWLGTDHRKRMGLLGTGEKRLPAEVGTRRMDDGSSLRFEFGFEDCAVDCQSSWNMRAGSLVPSSAIAWSEQHLPVHHGRIGTVFEFGFGEASGAGFTSGGLFYAARLSETSLLRLEAGALVERDTFMGSGFGGALELGAGRGRYVSAQLGTELGDGALSASYTLGSERAGKAVGSYVAEVEDARYDGYRIAFGGKGWEVHHTVPLAATGGGMRIESVGGYTGENGDWSIMDTSDGIMVLGEASSDDWEYRTDRHWIDFGAGARERRLGLTLSRPLGAWDATLAAEHVSNSPRESYAGSEARVAVGLRLGLD